MSCGGACGAAHRPCLQHARPPAVDACRRTSRFVVRTQGRPACSGGSGSPARSQTRCRHDRRVPNHDQNPTMPTRTKQQHEPGRTQHPTCELPEILTPPGGPRLPLCRQRRRPSSGAHMSDAGTEPMRRRSSRCAPSREGQGRARGSGRPAYAADLRLDTFPLYPPAPELRFLPARLPPGVGSLFTGPSPPCRIHCVSQAVADPSNRQPCPGPHHSGLTLRTLGLSRPAPATPPHSCASSLLFPLSSFVFFPSQAS